MSGRLAVVDLDQLMTSARIPLGLEPYGVVADPRGDLALREESMRGDVPVRFHHPEGRLVEAHRGSPLSQQGSKYSETAQRVPATSEARAEMVR